MGSVGSVVAYVGAQSVSRAQASQHRGPVAFESVPSREYLDASMTKGHQAEGVQGVRDKMALGSATH